MAVSPLGSSPGNVDIPQPSFINKVAQTLKNGKYWIGIAIYFSEGALFYGCTFLIGRVSLYIGVGAIVTTFIMRSIWWTKRTPPPSPSLNIPLIEVPNVDQYFSQQERAKQKTLQTFQVYERQDMPTVGESGNISVTISSDDSLSYAESLHKKTVLIIPANSNSPVNGNSYEEYLRKHTTLKKAERKIPKTGKNYNDPLSKDRVYIFPYVDVLGVEQQPCAPFELSIISYSSQKTDWQEKIRTILQAAASLEDKDSIVLYLTTKEAKDILKQELVANPAFAQRFEGNIHIIVNKRDQAFYEETFR